MMTPLFRVVLIAVSAGTLAAILGRIRRAKLDIEDAVFWILLSLMFVVFALFPVVPDTLAALLGIYSTANFLFLFMIFILLLKMFAMSMKIGRLEERIRTLAQKLALERAEACGTAGKDMAAGAHAVEEGCVEHAHLRQAENGVKVSPDRASAVPHEGTETVMRAEKNCAQQLLFWYAEPDAWADEEPEQ